MPTPWTCAPRHDGTSTFAHHTCTVRWPRILQELADTHPRHTRALHALRDEVLHGVVTSLPDDAYARSIWDDALVPMIGRPWTQAPWYVAEAFLYRRILEATDSFGGGGDPFLSAKLHEEDVALARLRDDDRRPADRRSDDAPVDLRAALHRALWGNRVDLSLPTAKALVDVHDDDLLVDDTDAACALLVPGARVAIALDNAGAELIVDLLLAAALARAGLRVSLWAKPWPFFVSDATAVDVARATARLIAHGVAMPALRVHAPHALGGPCFFDAAMPDELRALWRSQDVVISKGDCNYRRLVRDVPHAYDDRRTFAEATRDVGTAVLALRTLKAEVLVGVPAEVCARAAARDPQWLVSGRAGVIQLGGVVRG